MSEGKAVVWFFVEKKFSVQLTRISATCMRPSADGQKQKREGNG